MNRSRKILNLDATIQALISVQNVFFKNFYLVLNGQKANVHLHVLYKQMWWCWNHSLLYSFINLIIIYTLYIQYIFFYFIIVLSHCIFLRTV